MMIRDFRKIISLGNLRRGSLKGQIATLMILMIVFILGLILVTVNIGQVGVQATMLANAADSGALFLASQLASTARSIGEYLGGIEVKDKKEAFRTSVSAQTGGTLTWLVPIGIVVGILLALPTGGTSVAAGAAIGGAVSGALQGASIHGSFAGTLDGAISGLASGAAVGYGLSHPIIFPGTAGIVTAEVLTIAATIYNQQQNLSVIGTNITSLIKALNGLSQRSRIREAVLFNVFSQLVDDPNKTNGQTEWYEEYKVSEDGNSIVSASLPSRGADALDLDGDGDIQEAIPQFLYWWDQRVRKIKALEEATINEATRKFVDGAFKEFTDDCSWARGFNKMFAECLGYCFGQAIKGLDCNCEGLPFSGGPLARSELDRSEFGLPVDGTIIALLRRLNNAGKGVSFWQPGPSKEEYQAWINGESEAPPLGYDQIDEAIGAFDELILLGAAVRASDVFIKNGPELAYNLGGEESRRDDDYYHIFKEIKNKLIGWKQEIIGIRDALPQCQGPDPNAAFENPPCRIDDFPQSTFAARIDSQGNGRDDQLTPAVTDINKIIESITKFLVACNDFYKKMQVVEDNPVSLLKVKYKWEDKSANDIIRHHYVTVEVAPFEIPRSVKNKHHDWAGTEITTLNLVPETGSPDSTWVKVTRGDEADTPAGISGRWSPLKNLKCESGICYSEINRTSKAKWVISNNKTGKFAISIAARR